MTSLYTTYERADTRILHVTLRTPSPTVACSGFVAIDQPDPVSRRRAAACVTGSRRTGQTERTKTNKKVKVRPRQPSHDWIDVVMWRYCPVRLAPMGIQHIDPRPVSKVHIEPVMHFGIGIAVLASAILIIYPRAGLQEHWRQMSSSFEGSTSC